MPQVRRDHIPPALFAHLRLRVEEREITGKQLILFSQWLDRNPEVPSGRWFKRFPGLIVCGEGEFVKTFLRIGQIPDGTETF